VRLDFVSITSKLKVTKASTLDEILFSKTYESISTAPAAAVDTRWNLTERASLQVRASACNGEAA
jgi:hypothetical protein